jgi:hypothetical protein
VPARFEQRAARLFRFLGLLATPDLSMVMIVALADEPAPLLRPCLSS